MNENLDLTVLLKDCPKGTKLYSPLFGEVEFLGIKEDTYPINIKASNGDNTRMLPNGKYAEGGEVMLFPSKDNRDWSTFQVPKPEPELKPELKPFDRVLVRNFATDFWQIDFFMYKIDDMYKCMVHSWYTCIPFEGNEALLGTTNNPK